MLSSSSPVSARAEKKARAQMKFTLGEDGGGVEEVLKGSLHSLDACWALLMSYLAGQGNMGKPSLVIHERGTKEGFHRVVCNIVAFTKWKVLES